MGSREMASEVGRLGEGLPVKAGPPAYKGFRYPSVVIAHCMWLYHRFPLLFRDAGEMMLERSGGSPRTASRGLG